MHARPLRALLGAAALLAALGPSRPAAASPTFPAAIQEHLGLSYTPDCSLCHANGQTGLGTVTTPFGVAMREHGLSAGNTAAVATALDQLASEKVDSDGDGVGDVDELIAKTDPNSEAALATAVPDPAYGCFATIAKGSSTGSVGGGGAALVFLVLGAALVARRRRRGYVAAAALAASTVAIAACYETSYVSPEVCSTGLAWTGGDHESPVMNPGKACITCHRENEGPQFVLAGTVFSKQDEADECFGVSDTVVVVTGDDGKSVEMKTNESGNFYTELPVKFPYRAMVVSGDKKRIMATPQSLGDCNSCHTPSGDNGAPGRILTP